MCGIRAGALTQRAFTALKIAALFAVMAMAILPARALPIPAPVELTAPTRLFTAVGAAWYAYLGWQDIALLSEELREPSRDLPAILLRTVLLVAGLYLALNLALLWGLRGDPAVYGAFPALDLARSRLGRVGEAAMSVGVLISMLGGAAESLMVRPRIAFSLARDRLAPRALAWVNGGGAPAGALIFHSVLVAAFTLSGSFERLLGLLVFSQALTALLEALSYFPLRRRFEGPRLTPFHPWLPAAFALVNGSLCVWIAFDDPRQVAYAGGLVTATTVAYAVVRAWGARRARKNGGARADAIALPKKEISP